MLLFTVGTVDVFRVNMVAESYFAQVPQRITTSHHRCAELILSSRAGKSLAVVALRSGATASTAFSPNALGACSHLAREASSAAQLKR